MNKRIVCTLLSICILWVNSFSMLCHASGVSETVSEGTNATDGTQEAEEIQEAEETQETEETTETEENGENGEIQEEEGQPGEDEDTQEDPQPSFGDSYRQLRPTIKARPTNKKIRISFTGLQDSSYYVLQRSTRKTGGFRTIAIIKSSGKKSYLDSKVTFGKTYYYRIRGIAEKEEKIKSKWSNVIHQCATLTEPTIYAADRMNESTVCVYWEPDKLADGYVIYRSTGKDGTYKKIGQVKNKYEYRFVKKNCKRSARYYYKVRSYAFKNGKKIYSSLSESFSGELWKESVLYELFPKGVPKTRSGMSRYMKTISVPIVTGSGQRSSMRLTVHKKLVSKVRSAFREMADAGIAVDKSCTGAYNYRYMTSGMLLSHHSYGCAIDINWTYNPYVSYERLLKGYKRTSSKYTIRSKCVAIWQKYGFVWGGDWKTYKDYMHFSYTGH